MRTLCDNCKKEHDLMCSVCKKDDNLIVCSRGAVNCANCFEYNVNLCPDCIDDTEEPYN